MKTQTSPDRKINSITPGRWATYAAAGAATALTCANSAEAEIHYSGNVSIRLFRDAHASLPLSNDASLFFINLQGQSTFLQDLNFIIKGAISASARESRIHRWVSNLFSGENVSAGRFYSVAGHPGIGILFTNWSDGNFDPIIPSGFIGFRFNTGKGTQYGWARVEGRNINFHVHTLIKDYAWGDVGDAILTGQKQSLQPTTANSVAGSLGLLAFGSQGLDAWRAQRTHESN